MTKIWKKRLVAVGALFAAGLGLFATTFCASPLPAPAPFTEELPSATPPAEVAIFQLPTGVTHRSAAFGYRGGSVFDERDFVMTAALVRHPKGDILVDTGFGREIDAQFAKMPFWFRATTRYERSKSAADQLDEVGYDRRRLRAIVLTHAHWDHVSGVPDFPDTPVWVTPEERRFIREGGFVTEVARGVPDERFEEYSFEDGPYLGYEKSRDVYGDGAIVMVPAPGHTPGSVIVFVTLATKKRYALLGDLVWQTEGITEREERPWLQRTLADSDAAAVRDALLHVNAIATRFPELTLVPAHDRRGFEAMPELSASSK